MLPKSIQPDHEIGSVITLTMLWLMMAFLFFAFSFVSNGCCGASYYVIASQQIVFLVTAFSFPALSVLIAKLALFAEVKMYPISIIFSTTIMLGAILSNPNLRYTVPLFLLGSLLSSFLCDKYLRSSTMIFFGGSWILIYTPFAYKLVAYAIGKQIISLNNTYLLIPALTYSYPKIISFRILCSLIVNHFLS